MISARCVARDLHTISLWPLECTCWRHFAAQWDCQKSQIVPFNVIISIIIIINLYIYHLVGLVVKASASRAEDPRFKSRLHQDFFGLSHTSDLPGVIGSVLGLVGLVSVYCDWVRLNVWSATSVCQHVKLSEQICPWDTLACCWTLSKQQTNQPKQLQYVMRPSLYHNWYHPIPCANTAQLTL